MPPFLFRRASGMTQRGHKARTTRRGGARRVRSDGPKGGFSGYSVWTGSRRRRQPPRPRGRGGHGPGRRGAGLALPAPPGAVLTVEPFYAPHPRRPPRGRYGTFRFLRAWPSKTHSSAPVTRTPNDVSARPSLSPAIARSIGGRALPAQRCRFAVVPTIVTTQPSVSSPHQCPGISDVFLRRGLPLTLRVNTQ